MKFDLDDLWLEKMERLTGLSRLQKRRLYRVFIVAAAGVSYLVDTILLILFSRAGTIAADVVVFYGCAALGHVLIFSTIHWSGLSDKSRNPHWSLWQMIYAIAMQIIAAILAPKLSAFFMGVIFMIFSFGALRATLREALLVWLVTSLVIVGALAGGRVPSTAFWVPDTAEGVLVAVSFALILLRCIVIVYYSTMLRMKLYEKSSDFETAANHDALTGLLNRSVVIPAVTDQIALCQRNTSAASLAMLDIDDFKTINDNLGHAVGDIVLARLGSLFQDQARESDMIGRYGGEEFIFLLPATHLQQAMEAMERIRIGVSRLSWHETGSDFHITVSSGVTEITASDTVNTVIQRADAALYAAKRSGKNTVRQLGKIPTQRAQGSR